jgi:hypothetical protein
MDIYILLGTMLGLLAARLLPLLYGQTSENFFHTIMEISIHVTLCIALIYPALRHVDDRSLLDKVIRFVFTVCFWVVTIAISSASISLLGDLTTRDVGKRILFTGLKALNEYTSADLPWSTIVLLVGLNLYGILKSMWR